MALESYDDRLKREGHSFRVTVERLHPESTEAEAKYGEVFSTGDAVISELFVKTISDRVENTIRSYRGLAGKN